MNDATTWTNAGRFVGVEAVAGHLGCSVSWAKRLLKLGLVPSRRNERTRAYEVEVSVLESLRRKDVLQRPERAGARALMHGALDAVQRACRALGADVSPAPTGLPASRLAEARSECVRARRDLLTALGSAPGDRDAREAPDQDHETGDEMQASRDLPRNAGDPRAERA